LLEKLTNQRDKCLFILGIYTGFRISELLSIRVGDLYERKRVLHQVRVQRSHTKGKTKSRTVPLHKEAKLYVKQWIDQAKLSKDDYLFKSKKGGTLDRRSAHRILKTAFRSARVAGPTGTHSMRKTFAERVYAKLEKDLIKTQKALGHSSIDSTAKYLSFDESEIDDAILSD
jgi:integrase